MKDTKVKLDSLELTGNLLDDYRTLNFPPHGSYQGFCKYIYTVYKGVVFDSFFEDPALLLVEYLEDVLEVDSQEYFI